MSTCPSRGVSSNTHSPETGFLTPEVAREILFDKILNQLADSSVFGSGLSPTIFIVYAHNNENEGTAYDEYVRKIITWLERVHAQIISDQSPLLPLVSKIEGTDPIGNILASQMCLLPPSCYGTETPKTICVDKVIVCGSEVMESYCRKPFAQAYIHEIAQTCTNSAGQPARLTLESTVRERVENECGREDFHHVLTELAFLKARKSVLSETHGMVPLVLNQTNPEETPLRYLPVFWNTDVKLKLKNSQGTSLHKLFFKLLKRLFPDDRDLVQPFRECYDWVIDHFTLDEMVVVSRKSFDEIVNQRITKAYQEYWKLSSSFVRDGNLQARTGKLNNPHVCQFLEAAYQAKHHEILEWLSPVSASEFHGKFHDSGTSRMQDTCDWLIQNESFSRWYACEGSALLLLKGDMGTGKSYCTSRVIDWIKESLATSEKEEAFAFFYCNKQDKARSEPKEILRNIIRQLAPGPWKKLATSNTVHKTVSELFGKSKVQGISSTFAEWEECLSALIDTYSRTTIVLDGLDECAGLQRQDFINLLVKHTNMDSNVRSVKIFLSTRPEEDIVQHLDEYPVIRMQEAQSAGDIATFVRAKIAEHHRWFKMPNYFQNEIIDTLLDKSGNMFLFASLQIQHLLRCSTRLAIQARLERLPDSLATTYEEIYHQATPNQDERILLDRALRWVMCSARPLETDELLFAISQDSQSGTVTPQRQDLDEELILTLSQNLLTLDNSSLVMEPVWRLAHQAVAEYLESGTCCKYDFAHCEAGKVCLTILLEIFGEPPGKSQCGPSHASEDGKGCHRQVLNGKQFSHQRTEHIQLYDPLVEYAIYAWPTHVHGQKHRESQSYDALYQMLQEFLDEPEEGSSSYKRWQEHISHDISRLVGSTQSSHIMYEHSFPLLFDLDVDVNVLLKNTSLLAIAVKGRWESLTRRLLENGADVNMKCGSETNALEFTLCENFDARISRVLIEHGAQITGKAVAAACWWEAKKGGDWDGITQLLLANDLEINKTWWISGQRTSALVEVVRQGCVNHAHMLLKHGADVKLSVEGEYGDALGAVFLKTLDRGWDRGDFYPTRKMLDTLVEAGADLESLEGDRLDVALAASAIAGLEDKLQFWLDRGASPNAPCHRIYRTALGAAAASEHPRAPEIVRTLLNNGADVNFCFLDEVEDRSHQAALALDFPLHLMIETRWGLRKPESGRNQHLDTWLQSALVLVSHGAVWDTDFNQWRDCLDKEEPGFSQRNAESLDIPGRDIETNRTSLLNEFLEAESDHC